MSDNLANILEDSGKSTSTAADLKQIQELGIEQVALENKLMEAEQTVKHIKRELFDVAEKRLPEALLAIGMTSFTLEDGSTISCGKSWEAHISADHLENAHEWLRTNGHGDIIKNEIKVNFGKDQDAAADALKTRLNDEGQVYTSKEAVHKGTLKAFVKGEAESGNPVPQDLFGTYLITKSKVTRRN